MPVLPPNAPELLGGPTVFESRLPPAALVSGSLNPLFSSLTASDFGARHLDDADTLASLVSRSTAITTGWPSAQLDSLAAVVAVAADAINPADVAAVLEVPAKLAEIFGDVQKAIGDAVSAVPMVGWVLNLGVLAFKLVQIARARAPEVTNADALAYDRAVDTFVSDSFIQRSKSADWTGLFSPPPGGFSDGKVSYTRDGSPNGFAWGQLDAGSSMASSVDAYGLCPGVAQIAGYWQSPYKVPGSTRDPNVVNVVSSARLVPATMTLSGLLWTANQAAGPMLARVDLMSLATAWEDYGDALEDFADSRDGIVRKQVRNGWRWYVDGEGLYGQQPDDVPGEFRGWGLHNLIAYRLELARAVVRDNMKTIACAYVAPTAPGLSDKATREQWASARMQLLQHKARFGVDASIIPDADYRQAMKAAQNVGAVDFAPNQPKPPKSDKFLGPDALTGKEPTDPLPPTAPEGPEGLGGSTPTGGAGVGVAVAAALAAWALLRK